MEDLKPGYIAYVLAAAVIVAGFALGVQPQEFQQESVGDPGSEHLHAYLFFSVNGSERVLDDTYLERTARVHFHRKDGILHVHAENVDLGYALETLEVGANGTCLEFGLESEVLCGRAGIKINGEILKVDEALDRDIGQGDSIVVWFGKKEPEGFDRELPPSYREEVPGRSV